MKRINLKKTLIVIIILLFLMISNFPVSNANDYQDYTITEELPDYIILNIIRGYDLIASSVFWGVEIKNIGDAIGGAEFSLYIDEYKAHIFRPDIKFVNYEMIVTDTILYPDETEIVTFSFGMDNHPPFFSFIRFECRLECNFPEKNTNNNEFKQTYFDSLLVLIPIFFTF